MLLKGSDQLDDWSREQMSLKLLMTNLWLLNSQDDFKMFIEDVELYINSLKVGHISHGAVKTTAQIGHGQTQFT